MQIGRSERNRESKECRRKREVGMNELAIDNIWGGLGIPYFTVFAIGREASFLLSRSFRLLYLKGVDYRFAFHFSLFTFHFFGFHFWVSVSMLVLVRAFSWGFERS